MPETNPPVSTTLYYKEGSSDKVYQASIEPREAGFVVNFAYGRRGSTLNTGTKTASPVDYAAARKIYDKLIAEKAAKGYTPGADGIPYQGTINEPRSTGILPQLLNPIDEELAVALISDEAWWAQEKFDGKRTLIQREGDTITGINRKGLTIALPELIVQHVRSLKIKKCVIDGESIGDAYFAFDVLETDEADLRPRPYRDRLKALGAIVAPGRGKSAKAPTAIRLAQTTVDTDAKRKMVHALRTGNREGVVFKRHDAHYAAGRPASGGSQVKLKFTATASCIVGKVNSGKRSVALVLLKDGARVAVGNVTIPANHAIPAPGDIVEVRYLYAYAGEGGSLYQPVFLGKRDDIDAAACTVSQLKFKAGEEDEG
ncbi:MAG: RNA ligase family protein [Phycisphaeraceae bacterium]